LFSADLTWLDMHIWFLYWILAFTVAEHHTTSANDVLDFSIFWTCSLKNN